VSYYLYDLLSGVVIMAHTALNDEEIQEFFDTSGIFVNYWHFLFIYLMLFIEELDKKIKTLADFIRKAKHFVVYTGAGRWSLLSFF
jgi:hypothetical protein